MHHLALRLASLPAVLLCVAALAGTATAAPFERGSLPATIRHKFGQTTVTNEPRRVVVVGLREQDALLSLGVVPVGTTEWFGNRPGAIFPWARRALGRASLPTKLGFNDGIEMERVAALNPDLIVAVYSGLSRQDYDTLSRIAPTIAQPRGQVDWGASWQDDIAMVGRAVGRPRAAARVLARTRAQFAAVRRAHPEFRGQTAAVATPYEGVYVYGPQDIRSRFMVELGFTFPRGLRRIGGSREFGGQLAQERMELIDVGALLWLADPAPAARLKRNRLYSRLAVRRQGRDIFLPERATLSQATSFITVLSIPLLVRQLVPKLARAADGRVDTRP